MLDVVLLDVGGALVEPTDAGHALAAGEVHLRPGVVEDLRALAGSVRLGAVADAPDRSEADVRALLAPSGVDALLTAVATSADAGAALPDPATVTEALTRLGDPPRRRVLLVGDDPVDAGAAAAAGIHHVALAGRTVTSAIAGFVATEAELRLGAAARAVRPADAEVGAAARARHDRLTKPPGSLGALEALGARLAAAAGRCPPPVPRPAAVAVFAADHGVVARGVSAWPAEVTAQMVGGFVDGGAAIGVLADAAGARVLVVDVGVAGPVPHHGGADPTSGGTDASPPPRLLHRKVRAGTADLAGGPAMARHEALAALAVGVEVAELLVAGGARALATGEMGIGNTTAAAAVIAARTGAAPEAVVGRGAGADDDAVARKVAAVRAGLDRLGADRPPIDVVAEVGGLEIAALAGYVLGGAAHRVPVVLDGVITLAAALVAEGLVPAVVDHLVAGHRSVEPGATVALDHLGLDPLLDLGLRLGEGSGAALALPIVTAAARVLGEMASLDDLGIGS